MLSDETRQALLHRAEHIPIFRKLGMNVRRWESGLCEVEVPYDATFDGVFESFHGGILMTIADSVACFAVLTMTGVDQALTTTDMNIRFLAPCLSDVRAVARVIKCGRTMCPVSVDLYDAHGKHIAVAQVNYIRLPRIPPRDRGTPMNDPGT